MISSCNHQFCLGYPTSGYQFSTMSDTTRFCLARDSSSRSRLCSCLLYSRLLVLIVLCQLHCSLAAHYHDNLDAATSTFNCSGEWCGEEWQSNRILKYNYEVKDELVIDKTVEVTYVYNCDGQTSTLDCEIEEIKKNITTPRRRKTITRKLESVTTFSPLNLHIISTDNINKNTLVNNTYPLNQDKIWQFQVPKGCRMVIYFSLFDIEKSDRCQNDNFTVQIEKNQQDIRRYCESLHKIEIRKTRVQLKFHSNDAIAREGMKAHVCLTSDNKRTDDELPCNCRFNGGRSKRDQSTESSQSVSRGTKSYRRIKQEKDIKTGELLKWLEQKTPSEIDQIMSDSEDESLRFLAGLYKTSLTAVN